MKAWKPFVLLSVALVGLGLYGARLIRRGFSTADQPSYLERTVARTARNLAIPRKARLESNPWKATPEVLKEARESFLDRCAVCHGPDGSGQTVVGRNLYPKVPDLRLPQTQNLTDGEIRYIIRNGVRLTGMPGWAKPHDEQSDDSWKLVLFIRTCVSSPMKNSSSSPPSRLQLTTSVRNPARSATRKSTNAGERRPWRMSFAIRASILTPSFLISRPIPLPSSPRSRSRSFTAASGSSVTSRKEGMTIFRNPRSGMLPIESGGPISWPKGRTGGSRSIRRTICSVPPARLAMAATLSTTTSTPNRWRSGTLDVRSAMDRAASM